MNILPLPRPKILPPFEQDKTHFFFPRLLIEHVVVTLASVGCGGSGVQPTHGDNSLKYIQLIFHKLYGTH